MKERHCEIGAAVLNEKIYVCGSHLSGPILVEVYDPLLNKWSSLAKMNRITESATLAPYNGKLFAIGRRLIYSNHRTKVEDVRVTEIYDPDLNRWSDGPIKPFNKKEVQGMGIIPYT